YSGRETVDPEGAAGLSVVTSLATSGTKVFVSQSERAESQSTSSSGPFLGRSLPLLSSVMSPRDPGSAGAPDRGATGGNAGAPRPGRCPTPPGPGAPRAPPARRRGPPWDR